ncbi:MAG TPA: hypothetical protein VFQ53_28880 [Kofleriaceae bacterium]|nr:hypothetical protein [Kofleriaceae bacterium]
MRLLLVARQLALVRAWRADAMVGPANSLGVMDGGIDLAIRDTVGFAVQRRVQQVIALVRS